MLDNARRVLNESVRNGVVDPNTLEQNRRITQVFSQFHNNPIRLTTDISHNANSFSQGLLHHPSFAGNALPQSVYNNGSISPTTQSIGWRD